MVDKCERCKHWERRKIGYFTFNYGFCSFLRDKEWRIAIMDDNGCITGGDEFDILLIAHIVTKPGFCCNNFEEKEI